MKTSYFPYLASLVSLPRITGFRDPKALREYTLLFRDITAEGLRAAWQKDYTQHMLIYPFLGDEYETVDERKLQCELEASERLRDATAELLVQGIEYADYALAARVWYHASYGAWRGDHNRA